MCQLFTQSDSQLWGSKTRSMRINGMVTSIRLELFFWDVLEEIALRDEMSVAQLITKLYLESLDVDHDMGNFTSYLRVCCSRYLSLAADGALIRDSEVPIAKLNASELLDGERKRLNERRSERNSVTA